MFRAWLVRASRLQIAAVTLIFGTIVFLFDVGLDWLMVYFDSTRRELLLVSDALTAALAAGMMLWVLLLQRTRHQETEERMQVIAEMNHHVRNALQVISFWGVQEADRKQLGYIAEAVERIEWALRDVLPRGVPQRASQIGNVPEAVVRFRRLPRR